MRPKAPKTDEWIGDMFDGVGLSVQSEAWV